MRTLPEIIEQVWETLPEEQKHHFASVRESAMFAAPEMWQTWLNRFRDIFNEVVPNPPKEDWHVKAIAALTTLSEEEVREKFAS